MWISSILISTLRLLIGVNARWEREPNFDKQCIYFANHTSHMDTLAIMSALPKVARRVTKPVAAADYWGKNKLLAFISQKGLNAVLIERNQKIGEQALLPVIEAISAGHSVIIFPEGTRSSEALPSTFKSGIYKLHQQFPEVELVPVYLENFHRAMPKGKKVPLPILCTIRIGVPMEKMVGEEKGAFLERARNEIIRLAHDN